MSKKYIYTEKRNIIEQEIVEKIMKLADNFYRNCKLTISEANTYLKGSEYNDFYIWLNKDNYKYWKELDLNDNSALTKHELLISYKKYINELPKNDLDQGNSHDNNIEKK